MPKQPARLAVLAAAGSQLGVVLGASAFIGAYLDERFGTTPWLFLVFLVGGTTGGFWNFLTIVKRYGTSDESGGNSGAKQGNGSRPD